MPPFTETDLLRDARTDPVNRALLAALPAFALPQGHLTAGCLFQATWNRIAGNPPGWGVKDYDVFYYDADDLSWDAEDQVIRRIAPLARQLGATIEVKNQARVHLWYKQRFGSDYPPLASAQDGIARYLIDCTCIGIEVATGALHAPYGLDELAAGLLRMNPINARPDLFQAKAESYRTRWPWLTIADTTRA